MVVLSVLGEGRDRGYYQISMSLNGKVNLARMWGCEEFKGYATDVG